MDGDNLLRRSQPAGPLDDDNLLAEILLRLPPQPSSLPRASLVCHRWRRLVSDNGFLRRFRLHHRRNPPLLGCFSERRLELSFMPMLEAPNRVPAGRFSLQLDDIRPAPAAQGGGLVMLDTKGFIVLGCRHGLVLISIPSRNQVLVWDPVTGDQHRIALPLGFDAKKTYMDGAVLRSAAGDDHHFQVILIRDDQEHTRVVACVYSSETDEWGNSISILVPFYVTGDAAVLGGDSLYWLLGLDNLVGILEIDFKRQSLAVIQLPMDKGKFSLMRAEGGGLGLFFLSDLGAQLWKRKTDCGGVASWELGKTLELNELKTPSGLNSLMIEGFAEDNNVVFLSRDSTFFMVQLEPLELKELSEVDNLCFYYPFESVYTAGMGICGGHGGAEHLHNA